jgi:hypothetical protein
LINPKTAEVNRCWSLITADDAARIAPPLSRRFTLWVETLKAPARASRSISVHQRSLAVSQLPNLSDLNHFSFSVFGFVVGVDIVDEPHER